MSKTSQRDSWQAIITRIENAANLVEQHDVDAGDGLWLESLTENIGTYIQEWNLDHIVPWKDWPEKNDVLGDDIGQSRTLASIL